MILGCLLLATGCIVVLFGFLNAEMVRFVGRSGVMLRV